MSPGGTQGKGGRSVAGKERRRVLVVEDEALICVETADTLEHQGFEVHIALSGEDALRRLRGRTAVLVLARPGCAGCAQLRRGF